MTHVLWESLRTFKSPHSNSTSENNYLNIIYFNSTTILFALLPEERRASDFFIPSLEKNK